MKTACNIALKHGQDARGTGRQDACPTRAFVRGLTILEMLVSTTLLALIVLGLTAMFVQTQKAFKTGIKQTDVTDAGRTITEMIAHDLSQVTDAKSPTITNLFWSWSPYNSLIQKTQSGFTTLFLTNQLEEIYFLVHTNTTWMGVGYVVVDQAPGVGSLYRYLAMTNSVPAVFTNNLFWPFFSAVATQQITNNPNFSLIADGVVHLKIRPYDQYGNSPWIEGAAENGAMPAALGLTYPLTGTLQQPVTNTLPHFIELEVGVVEPEAYTQAKSMSGSPLVQSNFMANAAGQTHIFRQQILISGVQR